MRALKNKRGFTLVELMIVVAIIGVLAALAIYGVSKYLTNAKTAEAKNSIGQMAKDATTAYAREGMAASILALGSSTGVTHQICGTATNKVPAAKGSVLGRKYQSSPSEWATGDQFTGWTCLKFSMDAPHYYMYGYTGSGGGAVGDTFNTTAQGDLNGDGVTSTFALGGEIKSEGGELVLVTAPNLSEDQPDE